MSRRIVNKIEQTTQNKTASANNAWAQTTVIPCVVIDFQQYTSLTDFYADFAERFQLPAYFGANLDALWDVLTSGLLPAPLMLTLKHSQHNDWANALVELMQEAAAEYPQALKVIVEE